MNIGDKNMVVKNINYIKYEDIIELIKIEWPIQFGIISESEMIKKMYETNDNQNDVNIVMIDDTKIIGWCRYTKWPKNEKETKSVHLMDIAIDGKYQRKGYASILVMKMIDDCKNNGNDYIFSRTFSDNKESIKLHEKHGFIIEFQKEDSIVWKRNLQ